MIKAAAIRYPNGRTEIGKSHAEIIKRMALQGQKSNGCPQGFVLKSNYWVNRIDAASIAKEWGQVPEDYGMELYSEDLMPVDTYTEVAA